MARDALAEIDAVPVLIVENEEVSAGLIASILETHGYETRIAANAEEAMALLDPFVPRAIVLDLVLPRLSGVMLARRLKMDPEMRDVPIIATGPFSAQDAAHIARDAGCADYVRKPIDPDRFTRLLRDHLERSHQRSGPKRRDPMRRRIRR